MQDLNTSNMSKCDKERAELASLIAEIIRRMGATYGDPKEWRRDITRAVSIFESIYRNQ